MDKYQIFILAATSRKRSSGASGFGAPAQDNPKKATREEIARWRARSEGFREQYLKKHPNSKFKDVPARGSIVTRSKKLSNKPEAKEMVIRGAEFLAGLGLKSVRASRDQAHSSIKSVREFLKAKDRTPFTNKAIDTFNRYRSKLSKQDQNDVDSEAREILNNTRERPSKTMLRKNRNGKLAALVGVAVFAAMFGGLALVSPDIAMFLGVKALDLAVESARTAVSEPLSAFLAGHTIASFFKSKDSDEYAEDTERKITKRYDPNNDLDDKSDEEEPKVDTENDDDNDSNDQDNAVKDAVTKQLGPNFDASKYELDEAGNLKRKK